MDSIFLIGPMAAGKSTIAPALAQALDCTYIDVDKDIEAQCNKTIPEIFATEGEAAFREYESACLRRLALYGPPGGIISCGGGAVLLEKNREYLNMYSLCCLYLDITPEIQLQRISLDTKNVRPLLKVEHPLERLKTMREQRLPLYQEVADIIIDADDTVENIVKKCAQYIIELKEGMQ